MELDTHDWDKKDFVAFILVYLAGVDGKVEKEELEYIANRLGKDHLDHIQDLTSKCNDVECLEVMQKLRPRFFPLPQGLETLKLEMEEFCNSGERYSHIEHHVIDLITRQL